MTIGPLIPLRDSFAICRLPADYPLPEWCAGGELSSVTRSGDELSIVCAQRLLPTDHGALKVEPDWRALKVPGPLDFSLTGVLASLTQVLAGAGISVFAISTFDTDYLLVKQAQFDAARGLLADL